eukprot:g31030.t1
MDHGLASQDDEMKLSGTPGAPPPPEEDLMNDIAPVKQAEKIAEEAVVKEHGMDTGGVKIQPQPKAACRIVQDPNLCKSQSRLHCGRVFAGNTAWQHVVLWEADPSWHWVGTVFIAYMLSGLGLGIFEVTFLSVITPLGKATKSWAIIGCPAGFATINILGLTLSSFGLPIVSLYWYIAACLPMGLAIFLMYAPRGQTELKTANFGVSLRQASQWMPGMVPFFAAQFLSHFAMENWPAIFYMFHPPMVPLFNPKSDEHLMKWGQFFAITYIFIFLGDSISRRIAIYLSTPSLKKRLLYLGMAMVLIALGLYLESLAIAIIIPLAIFMIFWGNGTIYGLTANHVDKQVPSEHNLASYSCWCFIGDLGAILGGILVENTHDLFCRGHEGPFEC